VTRVLLAPPANAPGALPGCPAPPGALWTLRRLYVNERLGPADATPATLVPWSRVNREKNREFFDFFGRALRVREAANRIGECSGFVSPKCFRRGIKGPNLNRPSADVTVGRPSAFSFGLSLEVVAIGLEERGSLSLSEQTRVLRHGREDQLSASGSRPDHVEEFERKLAAAQPCEMPDWRRPSRKIATASGLNAGAAAPLASPGGAVGESQPASELSHGKQFESALNLSSVERPARERIAPPADPVDAPPADSASEAAQQSEELISAPVDFPQGGGKGPENATAAAEPLEAANVHTHEMGGPAGTKQDARGWKFKALMSATSVAMVGAVSLGGGMLVPILELPGTTKPSLRESAIPDKGAAERPQSAEALLALCRVKHRIGSAEGPIRNLFRCCGRYRNRAARG